MAKTKAGKSGTSTSAFGSPGRVNHDSSGFYSGKLYKNQEPVQGMNYTENAVPVENLNRIYCKSSEVMDEIPNCSVHLMVTSPPYNAKKEYDRDLSLAEYRDLLGTVFEETYKKLVIGGRACINIANLGRKPYIPLHACIIEDMAKIGFLMRGEIIWDKGASASSSTAWGSWMSAANPVLRDTHEYILIFSKDSYSRKKGDRINTISRDDFLEWTKSVWSFPTVSAKNIGHPAPFPIELPHRLIQLYTFKSDVVLDPFCGSGTTCLAAARDQRYFIGYDIEPSYVKLAQQRLQEYLEPVNLYEPRA